MEMAHIMVHVQNATKQFQKIMKKDQMINVKGVMHL